MRSKGNLKDLSPKVGTEGRLSLGLVPVFGAITPVPGATVNLASAFAGTQRPPFSRALIRSMLDPTPPTQPARLLFIHHSCGSNWLRHAQLAGLNTNNLIVMDT